MGVIELVQQLSSWDTVKHYADRHNFDLLAFAVRPTYFKNNHFHQYFGRENAEGLISDPTAYHFLSFLFEVKGVTIYRFIEKHMN